MFAHSKVSKYVTFVFSLEITLIAVTQTVVLKVNTAGGVCDELSHIYIQKRKIKLFN